MAKVDAGGVTQFTSNVVVSPVEGDRQRKVKTATNHRAAVKPGNDAREPSEWAAVGGLVAAKQAQDRAGAAAAKALSG